MDNAIDGPRYHPQPVDGVSLIAPETTQPVGQVSPSTPPIDSPLPGQIAVIWVSRLPLSGSV